MAGSMKGIVAYRRKQEEDALVKAEKAIVELRFMGKAINFNSVSLLGLIVTKCNTQYEIERPLI